MNSAAGGQSWTRYPAACKHTHTPNTPAHFTRSTVIYAARQWGSNKQRTILVCVFFSQYFLTILHSIYHGDARFCAHRNITALSAHKLRIYRKCDSDKNKKTFLITCMELIIIVGLWKNRQCNTPKLNGPADIVWDTQSLFMEYGILRVSLFLVFVNWWFHSRSSQWIGFYCIAVQDREC